MSKPFWCDTQAGVKANAGTSVTADILSLRKREATARPAGHAWEGLRPIETEDGPAYINEYFAAHPETMLGAPSLGQGQYGREFALEGPFDATALRRAVERLPFDVYRPRTANSPTVISIALMSSTKAGCTFARLRACRFAYCANCAASRPYTRNVRTHSEKQVAQVAASIQEFGWTNPILMVCHRLAARHSRSHRQSCTL